MAAQGLDFQRLVIFERVAQELSFTRAASALFLSQPAVSAHIKALEGELGCKLFTRGPRGVALTQEGRQFLVCVQQALVTIQEGVNELRTSSQHGRVTIGTVVSASLTTLPPILERFHTRFPRIRVIVRMGQSPQIVEMLLNGLAQVGFVVHCPHHEDLVSHLVLEESVFPVAPPTHRLAGMRHVPPDALRDELVLLARWGEGSEVLDQVLRQVCGERFTPAVEIEPADAAKMIILQGAGLAFLPQSMVKDELQSGSLVPVDIAGLPPLSRRLYMISKVRSEDDPLAVKLFLATAKIPTPSALAAWPGQPSLQSP